MTDMPEPRYNPHRCDAADGYAVASDPAGMTLDDLEQLLAHRERRGYTAGYREREAVAERQIASVYDEGWRAGMNEQHEMITGAIGDRLDALNEVMYLLHDAPGVNLSEYVPVLGATVRSIVRDLGRGPYEASADEHHPPDWAETPEDSYAARVKRLHDWLTTLASVTAVLAESRG